MSATEVPEIVQLVFNMELLAISSMSEVGSEHKVCFVAFLRPLVCDYLLSINNEYLVKMTYIPLKDLCQNV